MEEPLDGDAYANWIEDVFPTAALSVRVAGSAVAASGVFALGYGISLLGADAYLGELYPYVGGGGVFWILLWLGWVESVLVDVWNRVYPAFGVDDETYREVVGSRLDHFYDDRRTLAYSLALVVLSGTLVGLLSLSDASLAGVADAFVQSDGSTGFGGYSPARVANYALFGIVLVPLLVTSVRGFVIHVSMLREAARLPFRDVHAAARQLEPLVRFSMTPATAWFAGVSLVLLWFRAGIRGYLAVLVVATLVFVGVLHIVAPLLILHDALRRARQELLREIRGDYDEIRRLVRADDVSSERISLWLEVTDRRRENAKSISTWVYDVPSLSRFVAASAIPWLTLVDRLLSLPV